MQYRGECWAGNKYGKHGKRPDSECNMRCKKDNSRTCGAGWRNEIFDLNSVKKTPPRGYNSIYGETYYGCFKDTGRRDLENYISRSTSPQDCFKKAMDAGYQYAAMQYG